MLIYNSFNNKFVLTKTKSSYYVNKDEKEDYSSEQGNLSLSDDKKRFL